MFKVNEYFDGKVKPLAFRTAGGARGSNALFLSG